MFLIKNCSVTGIFDKSMEHVGTKEIVPYQLYVPPLEGSLIEVLLYVWISVAMYVYRVVLRPHASLTLFNRQGRLLNITFIF